MAKRKIVWSHKAKIKLFLILEFYVQQNQSISYSRKLYLKFRKELSYLIKHPDIGIKTDDETIRGLIIEKFIIFYEITPDQIIVHTVWDCRQNPYDLSFK